MCREDSEVVWVVSPRPGRSLGRLSKHCAPRGQRTSGGPDVGAFPGRDTLGESSLAEVGAFPGRAIPRARVPFKPDDHSPDGGMNVCIG